MNRVAALRSRIATRLSSERRARLVLASLIIANQSAWFQSAINQELRKEFERAGIDLTDLDIDFYRIITQAVRNRVNPRSPDYDDFFQDVAMEFLDRSKGDIKKQWIAAAKRLQSKGELHNLEGFLYRAAQRYVQDLFRKRKRRTDREEDISDGTEDSGGVDLERFDDGDGSLSPEDMLNTRELYDSLMANLKREMSRVILESLVKNGITNYAGKGRVNNMADLVADVNVWRQSQGETPVSTSTMGQHYRRQFKRDLSQAIARLGDPTLEQAAMRMMAASMSHPLTHLMYVLNQL